MGIGFLSKGEKHLFNVSEEKKLKSHFLVQTSIV